MNRQRTIAIVVAAIVVVLIAVAATVVLYPRDVSITIEGDGTVAPTDGEVNLLNELTVVASPADGWVLDSVTVDGTPFDTSEALVIAASALSFSDIEVHIVFSEKTEPEPVPETHTIVVTSTGDGTITPSGTLIVESGDSVEFIIEPDGGYRLSSLQVDGRNVGSGISSYSLTNIDSDHSVHAVFSAKGGQSGGTDPPLPTKTLSALEITTPPTQTSYLAGDEFSPDGMTVIAVFDDGSKEAVTDYTFSPLVLDESDTFVVISYTRGGVTVTATQPISVVNDMAFNSVVTTVSGTEVLNGTVTRFSETYNQSLSWFGTGTGETPLFRTNGIVPGIAQTAIVSVENGLSFDVDARLLITDFHGNSELTGQLTLTVSANGTTTQSTVAEALSNGIELGTFTAGQSTSIEITLSFPHSENNNSVQGMNTVFTLGIGGYQQS